MLKSLTFYLTIDIMMARIITGLKPVEDWRNQGTEQLAPAVVRMAEQALYKAKENGRNQVKIYDESI